MLWTLTRYNAVAWYSPRIQLVAIRRTDWDY